MAEWVGNVRVEGAEQAAGQMGQLQSTTQATSAAMGGFNRSAHLVGSVLSGNVSAAVSGATTSLRGLWQAFKAEPFLTAIGAIAGAVAALVSVIEDRLIKATERYQKMSEGFRGAREMFNEAMGNTPTAKASRRAAELVESKSPDNLEAVGQEKAAAQAAMDAAAQRYRKLATKDLKDVESEAVQASIRSGDYWAVNDTAIRAGGRQKHAEELQYAAQQVADAKAVVDVWAGAWKDISEARKKAEEDAAAEVEKINRQASQRAEEQSRADAEKEKDRIKDAAEARKTAAEARQDFLFSRMTPEQQLAELQRRGRELKKGGLTAEEAPEFYRMAEQADALKAKMEREKADRAERIASLQNGLLSGPSSKVISSGDWSAVYDMDRGQNVDVQSRIEENTRATSEALLEIQKALNPVR